jgi:hypothetical protein
MLIGSVFQFVFVEDPNKNTLKWRAEVAKKIKLFFGMNEAHIFSG